MFKENKCYATVNKKKDVKHDTAMDAHGVTLQSAMHDKHNFVAKIEIRKLSVVFVDSCKNAS